MYQDYKKVLAFVNKLNDYSKRKYNKELKDIDKPCFETLFMDSDYNRDYQKYKDELLEDKNNNNIEYVRAYYREHMTDIGLYRKVEDMSDNDLMNFINCIRVNQMGDFVIIRYDEIRIFNNKVLDRNVFNIYDGLLRECRSIVLDINRCKIVSLPFYKFMNLNESEDYSEKNVMYKLSRADLVEYTNKLDGSFIQITMLDRIYNFYKYPEILASSRNIEDSEIVKNAREWYENHPEYKNLVRSYPEYTLMFEWISLKDKHVVKYSSKDCGLYLIGMRHKKSGSLLNYKDVVKIGEDYGVKHTEVYDITFKEMKDSLSAYKASEREGYVVNIDGFLVKMKCADYLNMVQLMREFGHENAVIRAMSDNRIDEIFMTLPKEYHDRTRETVELLSKYIQDVDKVIKDLTEYAVNHRSSDMKVMDKWFKKLPKVVRGSIKRRFFNHLKGIEGIEWDYLRTNNTKLDNNYINLTEFMKRKKLIEEINLKDYETL